MKKKEFIDVERRLALKAMMIVELYGGKITFDEFDKAMFNVRYFVPLNWTAGWGLPPSLRKANTDKLCIFTACELGFVKQTKTGYKII